MSLVIDVPIAISWLFDDESTPRTKELPLEVVRDGAFVPSLRHLEVANVLGSSVRRNRCDQAYADRSLERLRQLAIRVDPDTTLYVWSDTRALSLTCGSTLYDAAYLELALRLSCTLATADAELIAAAARYGIVVTTP